MMEDFHLSWKFTKNLLWIILAWHRVINSRVWAGRCMFAVTAQCLVFAAGELQNGAGPQKFQNEAWYFTRSICAYQMGKVKQKRAKNRLSRKYSIWQDFHEYILRIPESISVKSSVWWSKEGWMHIQINQISASSWKCIIFPHVPALSLKYNADWFCNW